MFKNLKRLIGVFLLINAFCILNSCKSNNIELIEDKILFNNNLYMYDPNTRLVGINGESMEIGYTYSFKGKNKFFKSSLDEECNIIYDGFYNIYLRENFNLPNNEIQPINHISINTAFKGDSDEIRKCINVIEFTENNKILNNIFIRYDKSLELAEFADYYWLTITFKNYLYINFQYSLFILDGEFYILSSDNTIYLLNDIYKSVFINALSNF